MRRNIHQTDRLRLTQPERERYLRLAREWHESESRSTRLYRRLRLAPATLHSYGRRLLIGHPWTVSTLVLVAELGLALLTASTSILGAAAGELVAAGGLTGLLGNLKRLAERSASHPRRRR